MDSVVPYPVLPCHFILPVPNGVNLALGCLPGNDGAWNQQRRTAAPLCTLPTQGLPPFKATLERVPGRAAHQAHTCHHPRLCGCCGCWSVAGLRSLRSSPETDILVSPYLRGVTSPDNTPEEHTFVDYSPLLCPEFGLLFLPETAINCARPGWVGPSLLTWPVVRDYS